MQWNVVLEPPHRNHLINWKLEQAVLRIKIVPFGFREHVEREIPLKKSTPNYGGERTWLVCPQCDKKINRLYLPPDGREFACRECHRLRYRSQEKRSSHHGDTVGATVTTRSPVLGQVGLAAQSTGQNPQTLRLTP
jgi:hypothetical protein